MHRGLPYAARARIELSNQRGSCPDGPAILPFDADDITGRPRARRPSDSRFHEGEGLIVAGLGFVTSPGARREAMTSRRTASRRDRSPRWATVSWCVSRS
jgi:hypothetical protein